MYIVCINFTKEVKEECACKHLKDRNSLYDFYIPPQKNALYGCMYDSWADSSFNYKKGYASVDVYKMIFCIYGHYRFQIYFALWFEIFTSWFLYI